MNHVHQADQPLLVITGPTASGKTAAALALAKELPIEVVSADSRQVYRHMDAGTAKPSPAHLRALTHHLIDVVDPDQAFSVAAFVTAARSAIEQIRSRGRIPVVVGGTGFYIKALIEGSALGGVPPDPRLRAELERLLAAEGTGGLVRRLERHAPDGPARLDIKNPRRLIRAIEIAQGRSAGEAEPSLPPLHAPVLGIAAPATWLAERIEARVDRMFASGLLEETQRLLGLGYATTLPSMSGVGYREAAAHLEGRLTLPEARQQTIVRTRQFARRQRTWFRHQLSVHWHEAGKIVEAAIECLRDRAARPGV